MTAEHDDLYSQRRRKLEALRARGIDPYPTTFHRSATARELVARYDELVGREVTVAGRLMSRRIMGRATFAHVQDFSGRVQVFAKEDVLGAEQYGLFKDLFDLGDLIGATGTVMKTRTGEVSVEATAITMLAKSLRPPPEKWHGLADVETRYRQRYLDLISNEEARRIFAIRSRTVSAIRHFLERRGFVEIETPVLQSIYGGAHARPFKTFFNALDEEFFLRISIELYLKRAVVGGIEKVFEIGRVFRNEGLDTEHSPEFTLLESYEAYADYRDVMTMVEEMIPAVARDVLGTDKITNGGHAIDLGQPWRKMTLREAILEHTSVDYGEFPTQEALYRRVAGMGLEITPTSSRGKIVDELLSAYVEPKLIQPTVLMDYPLELSPLAKRKPGTEDTVERFEAFAAGVEIANAYSELNDALDQRARFAQQALARAAGDEEAQPLDEDFVQALEHGMPPTGGLGIGIERLLMLLTDQQSIREVILFPSLRSR